MMPEMTGYEVLAALREAPETAAIPLIFLTAKADRGDQRQGMELGANDYLTKPFTPAELLKAVAAQQARQTAVQQQAESQLAELRENITRSLPHELNTPLNGILGLAEILLDDWESLDPAEARAMLLDVQKSGRRLYQLIQNFLAYAQIELIATDPERQAELRQRGDRADARTHVGAAALEAARRAGREEDLSCDVEAVALPWSAHWLQRLTDALADNAFKFSPAGTPVAVKGHRAGDRFCLTVADRGRGMTAEQVAKLGAYMQFERKLYEQQGSGLGLAIAQRLVAIYGGSFEIDSEPDRFTCIRLSLPLAID